MTDNSSINKSVRKWLIVSWSRGNHGTVIKKWNMRVDIPSKHSAIQDPHAAIGREVNMQVVWENPTNTSGKSET